MSEERYWLTPPNLEQYKEDRFDPFPYPKPVDWDALQMDWPKPWYANPPFAQFTRFARKAIKEGGGYLVGPVPAVIPDLMRARARFIDAGRYAWLECETKKPMPSPGMSAVWYIPDREKVKDGGA